MQTFSADIHHPIIIPAGKINLNGDLFIPQKARGIVLFAHGSGSSRLSVRNQFVANELNKGNIATLLFDLLTDAEEVIDEQTRELRFDIILLAERLGAVTDWIHALPTTHPLSIGYFGASTGAAAALVAAAERTHLIKAIVSRGGRPDLAGESLARVKAPTLLIVGGNDDVVIELNETALEKLTVTKELKIVSGATHLFEEPGTLAQAAELAKEWLAKYL